MIEKVFTAYKAAKLGNCTYRQLDSWIRAGVLVPSIAQADGVGSTRVFSFSDVVVLRAIADLAHAGINLKDIRKIAATLQQLGESLGRCLLVYNGKDVLLVKEPDLISVLQRPGQMSMLVVISLKRAEDEVIAALAA